MFMPLSGMPDNIRAKEKTVFLLHFSRFFVTLQEFSAFLCIKEVWGIEGKWGYELATVLNSTFCYGLHSKNTRR
jgi:hypothetical protein